MNTISLLTGSVSLGVILGIMITPRSSIFKTSLHRISHRRGDGCGVVGIENHFARVLSESRSKAMVFRNLFSSPVLLRSLILICSSVSGSTSFGVCKSLLGVQTSSMCVFSVGLPIGEAVSEFRGLLVGLPMVFC